VTRDSLLTVLSDIRTLLGVMVTVMLAGVFAYLTVHSPIRSRERAVFMVVTALFIVTACSTLLLTGLSS
jgi:uncharacterized membrane protein